MTKKHFIKVAEILKKQDNLNDDMIVDLMDLFEDLNPRFDRERFEAAVK